MIAWPVASKGPAKKSETVSRASRTPSEPDAATRSAHGPGEV